MIDINKQITYWQDSAIEDLSVADELLERQYTRHGLFFAHLALEKILKAHVVRYTQDLAPRIHNLVRLAELASLKLTTEQATFPAEMNAYSLEGRYPEPALPLPDYGEAFAAIRLARETLTWLINQLN